MYGWHLDWGYGDSSRGDDDVDSYENYDFLVGVCKLLKFEYLFIFLFFFFEKHLGNSSTIA